MEGKLSAKEDSSNDVPLSESLQDLSENNSCCEQCKPADNHFQTLDVAEQHKKADEKGSLSQCKKGSIVGHSDNFPSPTSQIPSWEELG